MGAHSWLGSVPQEGAAIRVHPKDPTLPSSRAHFPGINLKPSPRLRVAAKRRYCSEGRGDCGESPHTSLCLQLWVCGEEGGEGGAVRREAKMRAQPRAHARTDTEPTTCRSIKLEAIENRGSTTVCYSGREYTVPQAVARRSKRLRIEEHNRN